MTASPFKTDSLDELEQRVAESWDFKDMLEGLVDEISEFYDRISALSDEVQARISELEIDEEEEDFEYEEPEFDEDENEFDEEELEFDDEDEEQLGVNGRFLGQYVSTTGEGPLQERHIESIVVPQQGTFVDRNSWYKQQIVVIGRENFDKGYLNRAINITRANDLKFTFISQEALINYFATGELTKYHPDDPRIAEHPGLSYLASIGFKWPSTYAVPGIGSGSSQQHDFDTHPLSSICGYNVQKSTLLAKRRQALRLAISATDSKLGLRNTAYHIAGLVKWRKSQRNDKYWGAIERWEADLEWLRLNFYVNAHHSFIWPSTEE